MKLLHFAWFIGMLIVTENAHGRDNMVAKRSEAEKNAIAAIRKLGGRVEIDESQPDKPVICVWIFGVALSPSSCVATSALARLVTSACAPQSFRM